MLVLLMVGAGVLALFAFSQQRSAENARRQAESALARTDFNQAVKLLQTGPQRALAYLARALRVDPDNVLARSLALKVLLRRNWPLPKLLVRHEGWVLSAQFSPDGRRNSPIFSYPFLLSLPK